MSSGAYHDDETLREATLDDFQDVLDIEPNAYDGLDYLPSTYPSLISGHGVEGFVFEKQGKVAAFYSTQLVDGGQTLMGTAGRVKEEYRGQGLYGRFTQRLLDRHLTSPDIRFEAITVNGKNMDFFGQRLRKRYDVIMEKIMTTTQVDVVELKCQLDTEQTQPSSDLQPLTDHQLTTMFSQPPSHLHHLFPQQRILLGWHTCRTIASNVDVIKHGNERQFIARTEELISAIKGDQFPITLLSCGSHFSCQRGRVYDVDIFGNGSDEDMGAHIEWHLRRLVKIAEEKTAVVRLFYSRDLCSLVTTLQTRFPLQLIPHPFNKVFLLERDLRKQSSQQ